MRTMEVHHNMEVHITLIDRLRYREVPCVWPSPVPGLLQVPPVLLLYLISPLTASLALFVLS